ncbi:hypothetical protein RS130_06195 [Paraglaciecola aquimarina]|uniref:Uncharacterized protein n=1 Tax=Paraglaciecola aquimarina TaxID=1235557 RepID=A0ABU3SU86_9ALTE|nr:hypothetical protein [Paraglaciecola aquimarina]MDU0353575.1 hypothetical protein [Paraglaciecola aquimarina]
MFKLFKYLLVIVLLLFIVVVGVFLFALESTPILKTQSAQQVNQAESVKRLMTQISDSVKNKDSKQKIAITENQLNSLVGFAQRAHKPIQGQVKINPDSSQLLASYALPSNPFGRYINIDIVVKPGNGVIVEHVNVGPFSIPGNLALSTVVTLANWYTNSDIAKQFVDQVESVAMSKKKLVLSVRPLDHFLKELKLVKQNVDGGDKELRQRTAFYLRELTMFEVSHKTTPQSLAKFMGPLFSIVKQRSTFDTAAKENEAAIMALAIYAGHYRFANFVGDVQPVKGQIAVPSAIPMLGFRNDLNQHFIFSAAIKIISEQGLSIAIGEFKELMDRGEGGSGYSFIDLAADVAGVEFAISATDPNTALKLQEVLAGQTTESNFFPSLKGLPEGLNKTEFTEQFSEVDSPAYSQMVTEINRRVSSLPIHNVLE